ncbi:hypothetical protein HDU96_000405 [Phlyctochytrium bullatum]|nr:hypothetical protein HDU96_000405 [Phlyctochytrium bullatum]
MIYFLVALAVLAILLRLAFLFLLPKLIQDGIRKLELRKLVTIHELSVLRFTEKGVHIRLRMNVLDTRLPIPWLRAGLARPPTIHASRILPSTRTSVLQPAPIAEIRLSDPITLTGRSDLWIWQDRIEVDVVDLDIAKGLVRKVLAQDGKTDGIIFKIRLEATLQFMGIILYENLPLDKIIDVTRDAELKKENFELFQIAKANGEIPTTVAIAGTPYPLHEPNYSNPSSPAASPQLSRSASTRSGESLADNSTAPPAEEQTQHLAPLPGIIHPGNPNHPIHKWHEEVAKRKEQKSSGGAAESPKERVDEADKVAEENGDAGLRQRHTSQRSKDSTEEDSAKTPKAVWEEIDDAASATNGTPTAGSVKPAIPRPNLIGNAIEALLPTIAKHLTILAAKTLGPYIGLHPDELDADGVRRWRRPDPELPVVSWRDPGADGAFPGIRASRLPVETSLTSLSTGVSLQFSKPPSLSLKLGAVSFDIHLNGGHVASATVTGIELHPSSTRADLTVEVVPSVVKKPIRGLLSSAKGVLRGALNGTMAGLVNGEWGSGATVLKVLNFRVEDSAGEPVEWVNEALSVLHFEHDLDAVRRLGGAAKGAARDVKDAVLEAAGGLIVAGGNRENGPVEGGLVGIAESSQQSTEPNNSGAVLIACARCRSKKRKCDGLRPVCTNCIKANAKNKRGETVLCTYAETVRRRGPNKNKRNNDEAGKDPENDRKRLRGSSDDSRSPSSSSSSITPPPSILAVNNSSSAAPATHQIAFGDSSPFVGTPPTSVTAGFDFSLVPALRPAASATAVNKDDQVEGTSSGSPFSDLLGVGTGGIRDFPTGQQAGLTATGALSQHMPSDMGGSAGIRQHDGFLELAPPPSPRTRALMQVDTAILQQLLLQIPPQPPAVLEMSGFQQLTNGLSLDPDLLRFLERQRSPSPVPDFLTSLLEGSEAEGMAKANVNGYGTQTQTSSFQNRARGMFSQPPSGSTLSGHQQSPDLLSTLLGEQLDGIGLDLAPAPSHSLYASLEDHLVAVYFCYINPTMIFFKEDEFLKDYTPENQHPSALINAVYAVACVLSRHPDLYTRFKSPHEASAHFSRQSKAAIPQTKNPMAQVQAQAIIGMLEYGCLHGHDSYSLIGASCREAQRLSLHLPGGPRYSLSVFNAAKMQLTDKDEELRMRSWNEIFCMDFYASVVSGLPLLVEEIECTHVLQLQDEQVKRRREGWRTPSPARDAGSPSNLSTPSPRTDMDPLMGAAGQLFVGRVDLGSPDSPSSSLWASKFSTVPNFTIFDLPSAPPSSYSPFSRLALSEFLNVENKGMPTPLHLFTSVTDNRFMIQLHFLMRRILRTRSKISVSLADLSLSNQAILGVMPEETPRTHLHSALVNWYSRLPLDWRAFESLDSFRVGRSPPSVAPPSGPHQAWTFNPLACHLHLIFTGIFAVLHEPSHHNGMPLFSVTPHLTTLATPLEVCIMAFRAHSYVLRRIFATAGWATLPDPDAYLDSASRPPPPVQLTQNPALGFFSYALCVPICDSMYRKVGLPNHTHDQVRAILEECITDIKDVVLPAVACIAKVWRVNEMFYRAIREKISSFSMPFHYRLVRNGRP